MVFNDHFKTQVEIREETYLGYFSSNRGEQCPILSVTFVRKDENGAYLTDNFAIEGKTVVAFIKTNKSIIIDSTQLRVNSTYDQFYIEIKTFGKTVYLNLIFQFISTEAPPSPILIDEEQFVEGDDRSGNGTVDGGKDN